MSYDNYDDEFFDGFSKYGPTGVQFTSTSIAGEWSSVIPGSATSLGVADSLIGPGNAFAVLGVSGSSVSGLEKILTANYARFIGGVYMMASTYASHSGDAGSSSIIRISDGTTAQVTITLDYGTGQIKVRRGSEAGTVIFTSTEAISAGIVNYYEWDITIHPTAGIVKLWINGVLSSINLTAQNTRVSANSYGNRFALTQYNWGAASTYWQHLYSHHYISAGGPDTAILAGAVVETQFPNSDSSVQFTPGAGVLGQDYSVTASTNAPGANELALRQFTPLVNCTLNSVSFLPKATSSTAKFKAVVFAGAIGGGGALLSSGAEVVGCTSGSLLTGALATPQSLTGGSTYSIGYITDTSIVIAEVDTTTTGAKAANTYTSGAPGTMPTMTINQASWIIFGNCTALAHNYAQVTNAFGNPPLGDLDFNSDSTVGHEDLFGFPALSTTSQTIFSKAVKANLEKSDAGARTVDLRCKSSSTDSAGSNPGISPAVSYMWYSSYFAQDPDTSAQWTPANLNAALDGYKIAS